MYNTYVYIYIYYIYIYIYMYGYMYIHTCNNVYMFILWYISSILDSLTCFVSECAESVLIRLFVWVVVGSSEAVGPSPSGVSNGYG